MYAPLSENLFLEAVQKAMTANLDFIPPSGSTDGALYIRPLLYGSGPKLTTTSSENRLVA